VGGGFDVVEVTSPTGWVEGTLIYNTPNASTPAGTPLNINPIAVQYPSGKYQYILVDVTQAVRDWLNGTANNGLVLKPHDTSISVAFASKEDTTYSHDPVLVVQHDTSLAQIPGQIGPSQVSAGTYGINVSGTAATAGQFDHVTSQCAANLFAVGITPAGHANCFQVMFSQLVGTATKLQLPTSTAFTDQANTFAVDKRQTFTAGANYVGLNIAGVTANPNVANLAPGDLWFNTTAGRLNFRKDNTATGTKSLAYFDDISGIQSAAQTYTDAQVAAEAAARQAADSTITTNLNNEVSRAQGAESTLQTNINTETTARQAADTAEATTRGMADATLSAAIGTETTRATGAETTLQSNITALDTASAKLASPNTFTANNTFTGSTVDLSHAMATLPVQTTNAPVPSSGSPNACVDGQMLMKVSGSAGQQLFICNPAHDGWVMVNDDAATTAADKAYTDAQVAAEAAARAAADTAEATARAQGDADALSSANTFTTSTVVTEAAARAAGDTAAVASANSFTSAAVASEATARVQGDVDTLAASKTYTDSGLGLKANLVGGNSLTGDQSITGNATVNGTLSLPAMGAGPSASHALELAGADAGNNPNLFRWFVNNTGSLDLLTATGGNPAADSGLMIGPDGKITFATGQTFPGTQGALTAGTGISIVGNNINNTGSTSVDSTTILNGGTPLNPSLSVGTITEPQVAGLTTDLSNETAARTAGDTATLTSANQFTSNAVAAEATLRAAGDVATLASANAYTDGQVATINTSLAGKANLAGGNSFTGNQSITGNASITGRETVNGLLALPASAPGNSQPSNVFQANATDGTGTSQSAQLQALADGSLSFQFGPTAGPIAEKLSVAPTGIITFAPGQTFPGTNNGTVTQVDTGAGLTGGPISTTGTISIANTGVTNAMLQNSSIGVVAGTGIGVSGTSNLGGSFTIANTGVLSFNGRNGLVTPLPNDYSFAQLSGTDSATSNLVYNNQANLFTGGKQTLPVSAATFASLNFPNTGVTPSSPAPGDLWLTGSDGHLQFQSSGGLRSLAFTTDIAAGTVTGTSLTLNQLIVGNGSSAIKTGDLTGDVTTSGSTATTLAGLIVGAHTFSNAGNSFSGNGAGLTNLTAANISAGTAGINISGNAATASTAATATTAGNVTGNVAVANGGTGAITAANARTNLGAAASGANGDITSMTAVTNITSTGNLALSAAADGATFNVTLNGGSPVSGNNAGGNVVLTPGTGHGSGTNGQVQINGGLGLPGSTSGVVTIQPQTAAGTPTLTFPNASGTFAVNASSPLVLNATTGNLTCPTCGTGSGNITGSGLTSGQLVVGGGGSAIAVGNLSGDVTTSNSTATTLANSGVTAGTYTKLTVDAKGRATVGATAAASDLSNGITGTGLIALATSPALAGTPTAPTPATADSSTKIATTAYVQAQGYLNSAVTSFNGVAGAVSGVSSVTAAATNPGVTVAGTSSNPTVAMTTAQRTRNICYIAGADNPTAPTLTTSDSQQSFFHNLIGPMSVANTLGAVWCQTNANTASINLSDGGTNFFGAAQSCSATGVNLTPNAISILAGDNLNFSIAANPAAGTTRITVCIAAAVN